MEVGLEAGLECHCHATCLIDQEVVLVVCIIALKRIRRLGILRQRQEHLIVLFDLAKHRQRNEDRRLVRRREVGDAIKGHLEGAVVRVRGVEVLLVEQVLEGFVGLSEVGCSVVVIVGKDS